MKCNYYLFLVFWIFWTFLKVPLSLEKCGQNPSNFLCEKRPVKIMNWVFQIGWDVFSRPRPATLDEHLFDRFTKIGHWAWPFSLSSSVLMPFEKVFENCITILPAACPSRDTCHQTLTVIWIFLQLSEVLRDVRECKQRSESMTDPVFKGNKKFRIFSLFWRDSGGSFYIAFRISRSISL